MIINISEHLINEYLSFILNVIAVIALLYAALCFFSDNARNKLLKSVQRLREIKNLKEKNIDDFNFKELVDLRFNQNVDNDCVAGTRALHSSAIDNNRQCIKAYTNNGKLILEYNFLEYNSDNWLSYVIQGVDEVKLYAKKGYYISFSCSSASVAEFMLELNPLRAFPIQVTSETTTYYGKLIDMIDSIDDLKEICFVLKPINKNKLQGNLEISDLKLLKRVKSPKGVKELK